MTTLPAVADPGITALRAAIAELDRQRGELADEGNLPALALGLDAMRAVKRDLATLADAVEQDLANLMDTNRVTVDGVGTLERRYATNRGRWQSEGLARQLVIRALVTDDGEVRYDNPLDAVEAVVNELLACAPFTGSLAWRTGALRERGLDPDEWSEATGKRVSVQIVAPDVDRAGVARRRFFAIASKRWPGMSTADRDARRKAWLYLHTGADSLSELSPERVHEMADLLALETVTPALAQGEGA